MSFNDLAKKEAALQDGAKGKPSDPPKSKADTAETSDVKSTATPPGTGGKT